MSKLDTIRAAVNAILTGQRDAALQAEGWVHLYGASQTAALLASARGLDADICAAAGLLHDIYTFRTGLEQEHALHGAAEAAELLRAAGGWADAEIDAVAAIILRHSDKQAVDGPPAECLKDADVFAHWLYDRDKDFNAAKQARLTLVLQELGIPKPV